MDEGFAFFGCGEGLLDGQAEGWAAALGGAGFSLLLRGDGAEGDACASLAEEAHGGCANAARASGNECGATGERE